MTSQKDIKKLPIVYSKFYDITFGGLERLHVFDSCKWRKVVDLLINYSSDSKSKDTFNGVVPVISYDTITEAFEATEDQLKIGHSSSYLDSLKYSYNVAKIVEVAAVALIPNYFVKWKLLSKFRYHVGGTILAARLALVNGWAINVGGGFHHASKNSGGGFCVYADISIAIKEMQIQNPNQKFLIIDLDAHQGNGHETDFKNDPNVFIFDMYNEGIYPHDEEAKAGIKLGVGLMSYTKDPEYLQKLTENLEKCFIEFQPELIIYNAGTDCLLGDPLGRLSLTENGIIKRDEIVFEKAKEKKCPILMLTSGGYQLTNAAIIAKSIWNLFQKNLIQ